MGGREGREWGVGGREGRRGRIWRREFVRELGRRGGVVYKEV